MNSTIDERVLDGLRKQLGDWRGALDGGAGRVGWKIGFNAPPAQERYGISEPVIGHLTTRTQIEPGGVHGSGGSLTAEIEVALRMGREGIGGYAAAIELVDLSGATDDVREAVAGNVFHRGFALAPFVPEAPPAGATATVRLNGEVHATPDVVTDWQAMADVVARQLAAAGEALEPGDVIISGAVHVLQVAPGDRLEVDMGSLGEVAVTLA
jgi:2-keto-4-pentenoate hydratase